MGIDALNQHVWLGPLIWAILYSSDYYCTLAAARMYHAGVKEFILFEKGYELTPIYQDDIATLRSRSPRFFILLAMTSGVLVAIWYLSRLIGALWVYEGALGGFLLVEATVHLRHARNLMMFRAMLRGNGVKGRIEYRHRFALSQSAYEIFAFAVFYAALGLLTGRAFFFGGALICASTASQHREMALREDSTQPDPSPSAESDLTE